MYLQLEDILDGIEFLFVSDTGLGQRSSNLWVTLALD